MASGLAGAPLTKLLLASSVLMTLIASGDKTSREMYLDSKSQIYSNHQIWRLGTSLFPFEGLAEALVGWLLLYRLGRTFERVMGSSRYAVFVLLASGAALGSRLGLISALPTAVDATQAIVPGGGLPRSWMRTGIASGPYHIIFGLLPLYYRYVPAMQPVYFKLGPLPFSDKSSTYGLLAVLAAATGPRSLLAALYSLAFGLLYALPGPGKGLQAIGVPMVLRSFVGSIFLPLLGELSGPVGSGAGRPGAGAGSSSRGAGYARADSRSPRDNGGWEDVPAGALGGAGAAAHEEVPQGPEPDPAAIDRLMAMGFDRADVTRALRASFGNEEAAVHRLLGQ